MDPQLEKQFVTQLEANQNIVHKICRLYTHDQESHNDLFQEITIQLFKAYPKFRGDSKFTTWMYRVALNTAITLYRKSKRSIKTQDYESVMFKIASTEYDNTVEEQLKLMYKAIRQLNDIDKALVFLYLEDKRNFLHENRIFQFTSCRVLRSIKTYLLNWENIKPACPVYTLINWKT